MPTINDIRRRSAALFDAPLGTADKAEPEHFTGKRILAYFQPESWTDGAPLDTAAVPFGAGREIDVTREVLSLSVGDIHALARARTVTGSIALCRLECASAAFVGQQLRRSAARSHARNAHQAWAMTATA